MDHVAIISISETTALLMTRQMYSTENEWKDKEAKTNCKIIAN